ncbi:hypothetical protein DXG03_005604 [Asterophora parasitica]|uniref:Uncharacterized protein n=1 Tax=Asterophora parasitica TaxID=117018 RepID=A0A9P7KCI4_9AGAR|nr:hypothetical protein DXG03_005604 [Asterophora parasitica]
MPLFAFSKLSALVLALSVVSLLVEGAPVAVKNIATDSSPIPRTSLEARDSLQTCLQRRGPEHRWPSKKTVAAAKPGAPLRPRRTCTGKPGAPKAGTTKPAAQPSPTKKDGKKKRTILSDDAGLEARAYTPATASEKVMLYHGTLTEFAKVDLSRSFKAGDFSTMPAFYLTDRKNAALQFACLTLKHSGEVYVMEYEWNGVGANTHTFAGTSDPDWAPYQRWVEECGAYQGDPATYAATHDDAMACFEDFPEIHAKDMVSGPMQAAGDIKRGITNNFWQYAVMKQTVADTRLVRKGVSKLKCAAVKPGNFD